jgi:hypothetical protein
MRKLIVAFHNFMNAHKMQNVLVLREVVTLITTGLTKFNVGVSDFKFRIWFHRYT